MFPPKARAQYMFQAGRVRRWHTRTPIHNQTVGEHSWGVAAVVRYIAEEWISVPLLTAALFHDVYELEIGDIPAPAKWKYMELDAAAYSAELAIDDQRGFSQALNEKEKSILAWADRFEALMFCEYEASMGNKTLGDVRDKLYDIVRKEFPTDRARVLFEEWLG